MTEPRIPATRDPGAFLYRAWAVAWIVFWIGLGCLSGSAKAFPSGVEAHDLSSALSAPSSPLNWGADNFGRPLLPLVAAASKKSLLIALGLAVLASFLGTGLGATTALLSRRPRWILERSIEAFLAFPSLLPALLLASLLGSGWTTLLLSILLGSFPAFARLSMARTREILVEGHIASAIALGATRPWILRHHLLTPLLELASIKLPHLIAQAILAEATLTFLGVGAPRGEETWGSLLLQGRDYLLEAPHVAWSAGAPLLLTLLAFMHLIPED